MPATAAAARPATNGSRALTRAAAAGCAIAIRVPRFGHSVTRSMLETQPASALSGPRSRSAEAVCSAAATGRAPHRCRTGPAQALLWTVSRHAQRAKLCRG